ncbi:serine/threonine-protein kinase [Frankia sp. Cppng1_Ct_nod]|uniref:serine/threonine-protein kinase n=1 Tax=Frankia sp. Cppng1_Ct_nod TaxID=2897162 RepID=UPI00104168C1|nr:serine/threonine-protein kinase [Frankia sp. Cppng1_Ct_nod]
MLVDRARVAAALPGYELGAERGSGAFGLVLAGRHRHLNRDVAIKVLSAAGEDALVRFRTEARVLAKMDHPHIVRVHEYAEAEGLFLIVMELLNGGTLTSRQPGMSAEGACAVGLAVAEALAYMHAQGVLHRDIKPDNILFDAAGLLKVSDFGVAKVFAGAASTASAIIGTPKYMAPEQLTGGRLGPASDLYALGVVLYELLAGSPLFDQDLPPYVLYHHRIHATPPSLSGVPAPVAEVVMRALEKDPAARYASARAFAVALAGAATGSYGPGWTSRSGILLRLTDGVPGAGERSSDPVAEEPLVASPAPPDSKPVPRRWRHVSAIAGGLAVVIALSAGILVILGVVDPWPKPPNLLADGDFESNPWAHYSVLEPADTNRSQHCTGGGYRSTCFVEFNGGRSNQVSLYRDIGMPVTSRTNVVAEALVRCPVKQGSCRAVLAVWGDPGTAGEESQSVLCDLPSDGRWYHLRLDGSDIVVGNGDATFSRSHRTVRWELYNRTPGFNLDVDNALLADGNKGGLPPVQETDQVCSTIEDS